jgi:hypothetical protein
VAITFDKPLQTTEDPAYTMDLSHRRETALEPEGCPKWSLK